MMAILTVENYVDKAEKVIQSLPRKNNGYFFLSTNQIRIILSLTSEIYDAINTVEYDEIIEKIQYLRVKIVYQSGRERSVKEFVEEAELLEALAEVNDKESLILFCRYVEALVAYFKFEGGE